MKNCQIKKNIFLKIKYKIEIFETNSYSKKEKEKLTKITHDTSEPFPNKHICEFLLYELTATFWMTLQIIKSVK